tara:strand:+ start:83 stop:556 length:474 start_codon:yes stop_codon:yes gene_type:complete
VNGKNKYMKPITAIIKEKGGAVTYPVNQEVTLNADGSGGPIYNSQKSSCGCDKSPAKKIGLQGLGAKGNKGYHVGSPATFKKHNMYGKDGEVKVAKTEKEHLSLKDEGYGHKSPAKKKDACYSKVKSRYKKWPSAYASGALVKCRKVGAANWGNKSK